jgi:hypothetical protein
MQLRRSVPVRSASAIVGICAAMVITGGGLAATATSAAAAPAWSIVASPSPAGSANGDLRSVTCTASTNCFAVGQTQDWYTLIERWNGTEWSVVPSPEPDPVFGGINSALNSVGCTSPATCFAVGANVDTVLVERWNGTQWVLANAAPSGELLGISCVGPTTCHAVGDNGTAPIAMRWNGSSWSTVVIPKPSGAPNSTLAGVKCTTTTNCVAVGSYVTGGTTKTLVERWNGSAWSIVASPNPAGATVSRLQAVACPLTTACFATGTATVGGVQRTLVERGNGTAWSIVASPNPNGVPTLFSVGCAGAASCFAVGSVDSRTFVERWNGTAWAIVSSPNPGGAQVSALHGVNCVSATECHAVGTDDKRTLAQRWNGSAWTIEADPGGGSQSALTGVSCPTGTSCQSVGSYVPPGTNASRPLAERWNGTAWDVVATPIPAAATAARLLDIDCTSTTNCIAVGTATANGQDRTLVERWNGTVWSIMASPNVAGASNRFADVDCTSATSCFAVGTTISDSGGNTSLVERGNGTTWTIATGAVTGRLDGVSCVTGTDCFAVGSSLSSPDVVNVLVRHWNGSSWTTVAGPVSPGTPDFVEGTAVSCSATNACMLVATWENYSGAVTAFTGHWDGSAWSSGPLPAPDVAFPSDVSCLSASDCTAVGNFYDYPVNRDTLVDHWDGSTWSTVASPNPAGGRTNSIDGITCIAASNCVGVGSSISDGFQHTLVERYS